MESPWVANIQLFCASTAATCRVNAAGPEAQKRFNRLKAAAKRMYWGRDAHSYGLLALGRIDLIAEHDLKPWDWAPLAPVIEAAGGVVTDWSGQPLRLGCNGSVLASANRALHDEALAILNS